MARISEQVIEQVRSTADIVEVISGYLELKKRGRNFFGLCPFHGEKTASFSVNSERQIYKCFGCGVGGGVINFIMEIEGMDFLNAIKHLASQYSIEIKIDNSEWQSQSLVNQLFDLHEESAKYFLSNLNSEEGKEILVHLQSRGLSIETIKQFKLGYSLRKKDFLLSKFRQKGIKGEVMKQSGLFIETKNGYIDRFFGRIIFSICNSSGKISGFAGRTYKASDMAKYVNSPETSIYNKSKILYGLHETKHFIREKKSAIVVEGYFDFLQLYQSGIKNIVAISGTAFTSQHAMQLKRFCKNIFLAYDGDSAGKSAAIRAGYILLQNGLLPYIINIPEDIDPDDWVKQFGNKPFIEAIKNSESVLTFHYKNYDENLNTSLGKGAFIKDVILELVNITNAVDRELQIRDLSELIGVTSESIIHSLNELLEKKQFRKHTHNKILPPMDNANKQLLEYDLIRLCFSKSKEIRKYLFENFNPDWLVSKVSKTIYDKIYIHLNSENPTEVDLIMSEIDNNEYRNEFANIIFDLDKIEPTFKSAQECVFRLEKSKINSEIEILRKELKNTESSKSDPIPIMKKINELQNKKNN